MRALLRLSLLRLFVERLAHRVRSLFEFREGGLDLVDVVGLARFARLLDRRLDRVFVFRAQLRVMLFHELFELEAHRFGAVLRFHEFAALLVFFRVHFRVFTHAFDLFFRQTGGLFDANLLFLLRAKVFRFNVQDTVGVDVKGDFDLR